MSLFGFGRSAFLEPEDEEWHFETWAWLLRNLGGIDELKCAPLVTPSRAFFPPSRAKGEARIREVFERVKTLSRLPDWTPWLRCAPDGSASYGGEDGEWVIEYGDEQGEDALSLVALFAQAAGCCWTCDIEEPAPGGEEMRNCADSIASVFLGFGLIGADSAVVKRFYRQGYLNERDWLFSLSIFLQLTGRTYEEAVRWLKIDLEPDFKVAHRYVAGQTARLDALRRIRS